MSDPALSLDNILKIVEIIAVLGGGGVFAYKVGASVAKQGEISANQSATINELKNDVRELNKVVTSVAMHTERMNLMASRLDLLDKRYEELRHGEGFVFPLEAHPRSHHGG